jgi:hypothetical protein
MGVVSGLRNVEHRTKPRLSAKLPFAFCDQAVEEPAIGIDATSARPTRMFWTSSGLCQNCIVSITMPMYAIGISRLANSP